MKMISSTSTTSMNGIMLISESTVCVLPFCVVIAMLLLLLGDVQHLGLEIVEFSRNVAKPIDELVVGDDRWNCSEQSEGRGQQSFRDAGPDRFQRCTLSIG